MAKHTSISLGDHFEAFVSSRVAGGRFGSASEVIRAALRLMEKDEAEQEAKMDALRAAIDQGIKSGRAKDSSLKGVLSDAKKRRQT